MSLTATLLVVVLGSGPVAGAQVAALMEVKRSGGIRSLAGTANPVEPAIWAPEAEAARLEALAREHQVGLRGHDATDLIEEPDVRVVIACLDDPQQQSEAIRRALARGKHVLAVPPLAPSPASTRDLVEAAVAAGVRTAVAEDPSGGTVLTFLEALIRGEGQIESFADWFLRQPGAALSPQSELHLALAALPPESALARQRVARALALLEKAST